MSSQAVSDRRAWARAYYARAKEQGVCTKCHRAPAAPGYTKCAGCREKEKGQPGPRQRYRWRVLREQIIEHYGRCCACCGEDEPLFLQIDHINNDGAAHRREQGIRGGDGIYYWLVTNNFPPGFQMLCANCNTGKFRNLGVCPHVERLHPVVEQRPPRIYTVTVGTVGPPWLPDTMTEQDALEYCATHSARALARLCGVPRGQIRYWLEHRDPQQAPPTGGQ